MMYDATYLNFVCYEYNLLLSLLFCLFALVVFLWVLKCCSLHTFNWFNFGDSVPQIKYDFVPLLRIGRMNLNDYLRLKIGC